MVSTPTTRNRFEKIGTGDKTNTWGTSLNENVFSMVDEALDGVALITVSGPVTLTSTNYTTDQARMRQLWLSGAGGATITLPGVEKWYLVRNACSAAVTFSAGGVTASVPASQSRMVFTNGTDVYVGDDGASLAYVDATFLKLTGGTMTGNITLVADGSNNLHPVTLQQLNAAVLAAAAGNLPALSGNALKFLRVNAGESSVEWAAVDLTGFQPIDADLTAIAALTSAANKVPYSTGAGTWAMADFSAAGRALVDDADNAAQRTTLGLGTIATQYANNVAITGGSVTGITDLAVADGGTGASDAAGARTNLGLGTMATQAASSVSISGGSITGITDIAVADGGTGASDAATARTNLGLAIGTNVQAYDPELAALASVTSTADALPYFTGSGTAGTTTLTSYARTLIDDADASTARTTLGLGTMATQAASSVSISGGSITGITDLAVADGGTGASTAAGAATNLGLGTGDSPQFTAVNVGHATDTTVTRVSAGRIAVEGSNVLMASDTGTSGAKIPYLNAANTFSGAQTFTGGVTSSTEPGAYFSYQNGNQGASFQMRRPATGTTIAGDPIFDLNMNNLRIYEAGGSFRGVYIDFTTCGSQSQIYHAGNLPGTSLTWTAAQTFSTSPIKIGDGVDSVAMTGTSPILRVQGASFTSGITVRRDGYAEVGIQASSVGNVGTWTNHALNIFVNAASVAQFPTGGGMTIGGNTVYHAGNLPGTAISWTAAQTINPSASGTRLQVGPGYNGGVAINAGDSVLDLTAWTGAPTYRLSRHNVNAWDIEVDGTGNLDIFDNGTASFSFLSSNVLQVNGNTVYHAGNLPGTALTWTAAQAFNGLVTANRTTATANPDTTGSATTNIQARIGSSNVGASGYGIDIGVSNADGSVWVQARDWSNYATNATLRLQPNGGTITRGGNLVFDVGNLPGTALSWTAQQTVTVTSAGAATTPVILRNASSTASSETVLQFNPSAATTRFAEIASKNDGTNAISLIFRPSAGGSLTDALTLGSSGAASFASNVTVSGAMQARIAASTETTGTLTSASANKTIQLTGNITINNSVFAAGDVVVVYAGSSSRTITAGTITTMRLDGTSTTGSRTVAAYGMASIFFVSATECVVSGGSVT